MDFKQSEKQAVLDAIKEGNGLSFDRLKAATGLGPAQLSALIGLLVKENRVLLHFNHAEEKAGPCKSNGEILYARFRDILSVAGKRTTCGFLCFEAMHHAQISDCRGEKSQWKDSFGMD